MYSGREHEGKPGRWAGIALVVAAHAALLYGLMDYRLRPIPAAEERLMFTLVEPTAPKPAPPRPAPAAKAPIEKAVRPVESKPQTILTATAPVIAPAETAPAAREPVSPPVTAAPVAAPPPAASGPVSLAGELSVACPDRTPPAYPPRSKRQGETGRVVLGVELDERGQVASVQVVTSSGYPRLDEAALAAVRQWRCSPPRRDGVPARATALQPFNFVLEGT